MSSATRAWLVWAWAITACADMPVQEPSAAPLAPATPPPEPAALPASVQTREAPRRVAVVEIAARGGVSVDEAEMFSEFLQRELRGRGHQVVGRREVEAVLGLEKMKDALGCDTAACMA